MKSRPSPLAEALIQSLHGERDAAIFSKAALANLEAALESPDQMQESLHVGLRMWQLMTAKGYQRAAEQVLALLRASSIVPSLGDAIRDYEKQNSVARFSRFSQKKRDLPSRTAPTTGIKLKDMMPVEAMLPPTKTKADAERRRARQRATAWATPPSSD